MATMWRPAPSVTVGSYVAELEEAWALAAQWVPHFSAAAARREVDVAFHLLQAWRLVLTEACSEPWHVNVSHVVAVALARSTSHRRPSVTTTTKGAIMRALTASLIGALPTALE